MTMNTERNISPVHSGVGLGSGYISDTSCDSTSCHTVSYGDEYLYNYNGILGPLPLSTLITTQGEIVDHRLLSILKTNVDILQLLLNNFQNRSASIAHCTGTVPHTVSSTCWTSDNEISKNRVSFLEDIDNISSYDEKGKEFILGDSIMDIHTDELFSGSGNQERSHHIPDTKNNDEAVTEDDVIDLDNLFKDEDMDTNILLAIDNNTLVLSEELKKDCLMELE
jgi:hypothetical protein